MQSDRSPNLIRFEEHGELSVLPSSVSRTIQEIAGFLDALDLYAEILGDLRTYAPLGAATRDLQGAAMDAVTWVNRYLRSEIGVEDLYAGLGDFPGEALLVCMNSLRKVTLDLPRRQMESFLSFIFEDGDEELLGSKKSTTSRKRKAVAPLELEDLIGDPAITYPFLQATNTVLNDTETLARRVITDLMEMARNLRAVLTGAALHEGG